MDDGTLVENHEWQIVLIDDGLQSAGQAIACLPGDDGGISAFHFEQGMIPGHTGDRIGRKRAANISAFACAADAGREAHDHIRTPAYATRHRVAAGQAFAEHGQVRLDIEVTLRAAQSQPEAGHNLIEDQQCAELITQLAHFLIEIEGHRAGAALGSERFDDDRGRAAEQVVEDQVAFQCSQGIRDRIPGCWPLLRAGCPWLPTGRCPGYASRRPSASLQP